MADAEVHFTVFGDPASQGSHAIINGRIVQVNSSKHRKWRTAVSRAAADALPPEWELIDGPAEVTIILYMPIPKSVERQYPTVSPDLDKMVRSIFDSLTGVVITDDSRIVRLSARKVYADGIEPGATISVKSL